MTIEIPDSFIKYEKHINFEDWTLKPGAPKELIKDFEEFKKLIDNNEKNNL